MVCVIYPDLPGICITALFLKGIPLIILLVFVGLELRVWLNSTKTSKLSSLVLLQGFFGSLFYLCSALVNDSQTAAAFNSPTLICWESGGLTMMLSWRLLRKIVKNLKPFSSSQERNLIIGIIIVNVVLFGIIVPLHVVAIFGSQLEGFNAVFMFVHIGLASAVLVLGIIWLVMLRKALAQALAETNHPAKRAIHRMMLLIAIVFVVVVLTLILQFISDPITISGVEILCGVFANLFFIYAQWSRISKSAGSSDIPGPKDTSQANSVITGSSVQPNRSLPGETSTLGASVSYDSVGIGMAAPQPTVTHHESPKLEYQEL